MTLLRVPESLGMIVLMLSDDLQTLILSWCYSYRDFRHER